MKKNSYPFKSLLTISLAILITFLAILIVHLFIILLASNNIAAVITVIVILIFIIWGLIVYFKNNYPSEKMTLLQKCNDELTTINGKNKIEIESLKSEVADLKNYIISITKELFLNIFEA